MVDMKTDYSKREHFKTISAVLVVLIKDGKVLLQKRKGTGFADGMWDFSTSGHVEEGESMSDAVKRETREEIGVDTENADFVGLMHSLGEDGVPRYLGVFTVTDYDGEPKICEPDKCSELKWFSLDTLPDNVIESRKKALESFVVGSERYLEMGWESGR